MKKINNKGYLLVEIIVAFTLAMAVAYFLAEITISLKNKEEDLNKKVAYNTDRALITKEIMDDSNKYRISNVNIVDNHTVKLTFDGLGDKVLSYNSSSKTITYGDLVVKLDDTLTEIGNFEVKKVDNDTFLTIKLSAKSLYSDVDYGLNLRIALNTEGSGLNIDQVKTLYNVIANKSVMDNVKSTYVNADRGVDFSKISSNTNGKGVYTISSTINDSFPIRYYRGAVTDNNVLFGGFCWKIVRTTDTGGVKLIYNGTPSNNQCTNTTGTATQIGTSAFNNNSSSPADVGYMYGTRYTVSSKKMSSVSDAYVYGNDVIYSNGTYTLKDTMTSSSWRTDRTTLSTKYHYTCLSTSSTCSSVYYIFYFGDSSYVYYLTLTGGDDIESAKTKMFTNSNDSTIKATIDNWYKTNMASYTNKLEDTIYCNDRTISTGPLISKDTSSTDYNFFTSYTRIISSKPSLKCSNVNDSFTVSSSLGNGKLIYPVGLMTGDEVMYAGGKKVSNNSTYYLYTQRRWWLGSPNDFLNTDAYLWGVNSSGYLEVSNMVSTNGFRPVISLKYDSIVKDGDGSSTSPYTIS